MLQQNVGGHPVAVYRFPPRTKFSNNSTITVWSGSAEAIVHQPPSDFVWKEQQKWGTGPECTTILCKPNGQVSTFSRSGVQCSEVLSTEYDGVSTTQITLGYPAIYMISNDYVYVLCTSRLQDLHIF